MKRLTIKQMEEFCGKLEAAELPEKISPWANLEAVRRTVIESIGRLINEMEYAGVKSLKLEEGGGEEGAESAEAPFQSRGRAGRKKS